MIIGWMVSIGAVDELRSEAYRGPKKETGVVAVAVQAMHPAAIGGSGYII